MNDTISGDLHKLTHPQLKEMCKSRGLKCTGNKTQLLARLMPESEPAPVAHTPKRKHKVKDVRGVDEFISPEKVPALTHWFSRQFHNLIRMGWQELPPLNEAQMISTALTKGLKGIQNYVWTKGTQDAGDSQSSEEREMKMDEEATSETGKCTANLLSLNVDTCHVRAGCEVSQRPRAAIHGTCTCCFRQFGLKSCIC